jgi:phenylacetate-CoA ligase
VERPNIALEPRGVEQLPLAELVQIGEQRLVEGKVIERASTSSLYTKRWNRAGVQAKSVESRNDLAQLPFTSAADVIEAQKRSPLRQFPCAASSVWLASDSQGESRKWIPYSKQDLVQYMGLLARLAQPTALRERDVILFVAPMAPRTTNAMPYLWIFTDILETKLKLEFVVGSMFLLGSSNWPEFALRRQPTILVSRPSDALALVRHFAEAAGTPDAKPKQLFDRLRAGIFFGESLSPSSDAIKDAYGLEAFDCYLSAEFPSLSAECTAHDGLHMWMDVSIPEVIPSEELAKGKANPQHAPKAVFLAESPAGLEGELVLTTFGEALPLVRYRTGDRVRVVSTAPCQCGMTHPRIAILGRL